MERFPGASGCMVARVAKRWDKRTMVHHVRNPIFITAAIAVLSGLIASSGCRKAAEAPAANPASAEVEVTVMAPIERELPRYIRVTGTLHGDEETTIAAKVAGRVVQVLKDLGDAARPGEPLIRIDPTDYELARAERENALAETLARVGLSELPGADFAIDALPSVERARLQAQNAKARLERARQLYDRDPPLISEQDFADLRTTFEVAESNLNVERLTAQSIIAEARTVKAQIDVAQQRVTDTVHRAPVMEQEGRLYEVAARSVTVGDYVQIGASLLRLVDADPLKLRALVPERRLGAVQVDQPATVQVEAFTQAFQGRVSRVSPAVEMQSRSFPVEILVPNADRALKPGSFASAHIEVSREKVLMLPQTAVSTFAGVHKVVSVVDGKAKQVRVELGESVDGLIEIRKGITGSEQIVVNPSASLRDGAPVRITMPAVQTASQPPPANGVPQ